VHATVKHPHASAQLDDDILTVFERFEVVWPLVAADMTTNPTSAAASTE
jgi:hypothetical protein